MKKRNFMVVLAILMIYGLIRPCTGQEKKEYGYVGTKQCKKCHLKEFKSWEQTKMANAYEILKPGERAEAKKKVGLDPQKDYTSDPKCLSCHTTGYNKQDGFVSSEKTKELVGVSCEMCHGAGSEYTQKQYMSLINKEYKRSEVVSVGLVSPVTGDRCTSLCHNENSPFYDKNKPFDFEQRKNDGTHEHFALKYKHE